MLSPERRKFLYTGEEIPKDRKALGYPYQVAMSSISRSNTSLEPLKDNECDLNNEESKSVLPSKAPLEYKEGGKATIDKATETC